jgi:hypothetical protein
MVPSRIGPLGWPHSVVHTRSSAPYSRFPFVVFYFLRKSPDIINDHTVAAYIYYCTVRYSIMARIKLCKNPPKRGK